MPIAPIADPAKSHRKSGSQPVFPAGEPVIEPPRKPSNGANAATHPPRMSAQKPGGVGSKTTGRPGGGAAGRDGRGCVWVFIADHLP